MAKEQHERYVLRQGYFPENEPQQPQRKPERKPIPKRLFILITVAILAVALIAAGIIYVPRLLSTASPSWSASDLLGNWAETTTNESVMKATVTQNTIEIYWSSDDTSALYWKGSFPVPEGSQAEKTVISTASPENATALMASSDPSKTFTVRRDAIIYDVSALGVTTRVTLKRVK